MELTGLTPDLRGDRAQALHIFEFKFAEAEAELLQAQRDLEHERERAAERLATISDAQERLSASFKALSATLGSAYKSHGKSFYFLRGPWRCPRGGFPYATDPREWASGDGAGQRADARCRYLSDYFSNTATKDSLGRFPKMLRTFQPVPRTS